MKRPANTQSPSRVLHGTAGLFEEPTRPSGMYIAHVDGAARGNPGPASYAVIVRAPDGSTQFQIGKYLGRATNNVAEYYALIGALDYAQSHQIARLAVRSDSELLVRQMQGRYKVKSPDLRPLHERAQKMARGLAHFEIIHVPRDLNRDADQLANLALDATGTVGGKTEDRAGTSEAPDKTEDAPAATARPNSAAPPKSGTRKIRARFSGGALHPLETLDLFEGEIVEISVKKTTPGKKLQGLKPI